MDKIYVCSCDLGTGNLVSARDDGNGNVVYNSVRNCYMEADYEEEFESSLISQKVSYIADKENNKIYILGSDAMLRAGMSEFSSKSENLLKRPMADGVINANDPKISLMILRQLMKNCIYGNIGPCRPNEIIYVSIPGNPIDSKINNVFHKNMALNYLKSLGFESYSLNEGLAIAWADNPKMITPESEIPLTGLSCSFGSGMANFCLSSKGESISEFSLVKSGDWVDKNVSTMIGQASTKVLRVKEKRLDLNTASSTDPDDRDFDVLQALDCYYNELINYSVDMICSKFKGNKGSIDYPIQCVVSGGTASCPGFIEKFREALMNANLPFEISEVRKSSDFFKAVATGCYLKAYKAAERKMAKNSAAEAAVVKV